MNHDRPKIWWYAPLFWVISAVSVLFYVLLFLRLGFDEASVRQGIRWSARFAAVLFCGAFGASSVHFFWKNSFSFWLRLNRKFLGLAFAFNHTIHLCFLFLLQQNFHPVFDLAKRSSLFFGSMAYLFMFLMVLTSFEFFSKMISPKQWKMLHTVGGWWIWGIFIRSYSKNALEYPGYLAIFLLLAGVAVVKTSYFFKK